MSNSLQIEFVKLHGHKLPVVGRLALQTFLDLMPDVARSTHGKSLGAWTVHLAGLPSTLSASPSPESAASALSALRGGGGKDGSSGKGGDKADKAGKDTEGGGGDKSSGDSLRDMLLTLEDREGMSGDPLEPADSTTIDGEDALNDSLGEDQPLGDDSDRESIGAHSSLGGGGHDDEDDAARVAISMASAAMDSLDDDDEATPRKATSRSGGASALLRSRLQNMLEAFPNGVRAAK